ncbi:DUF4185 domain-containing protein [Mycobacterium sp. Y57]|uniref:DUF4185 domain-containing protein n=1 Tax=Mycolicibacterium xanthum TaxID=2796469 RepID=UPI001C85C9DB|nr:DUF4185 domain-containing protein [Mycolicibacterium xanthum]MBX7432031.1 DUF4185 domain-containing protein [Mycolicibacterium xanthum]
MGAAAYVGRVGGLAVALGVGSAVFVGQGVAWAEENDSPTPTSGSSATVESPTSSDTETGAAQDADDEEADDEEAEPEEEPVVEDEVDEPEQEAGPEEEPAIADDAGDPEEEAEPTGETEPTEELEPETEPTEEVEPKPAPEPEAPAPATYAARQAVEPVEDSIEVPAEEPDTDEATTTPVNDPAEPPKEPTTVAVFASATSLAAAATTPVTFEPVTEAPQKFTLATAVVNVVNSMIDWAQQTSNPGPGSTPQPPFLWALLAFARRELENLFAAYGANHPAGSVATQTTSLALAEATTADVTTAAAVVPYSPFPNPQLSESTNFVSWVTGPYIYDDPTLANTKIRFDVHGTDIGAVWDNGMVDDPSTPQNEHQVLIAVGDTFGSANMTGRHIYNTLFRSSDDDLSDGMTIPNGEWFNGNMFGGAPLSGPTEARPIINRPSWAPNSVTLIPTAGISVPTEVTEETPFGTIQYVSFMSVSNWGSSGSWTTNYSAIAYSTDNGENFTVAPESVRYNSIFSGDKNFQQSAFVEGDDGYIYMYGTPNGRGGAAYLARVTPENITDVSEYEYYQAASSCLFFSTPEQWVKNNPSSASAIIGKSGGPCGALQPGYTVSEMSVQYNEYLDQYVVMYGDQFNNIVIRTSDRPEGTWSDPTVLIGQQNGGIYAPMMHPWSPSTTGTGSDLYWNLSLWSEYNVMLMRTDLAKL